MTKATPLPSREILHARLRYDAESGLLYWKPRDRSTFTNGGAATQARAFGTWAARYANRPAFNAVCSTSGYKVGRLQGRNWLAHRIIWKLVFGEDPPQIDHINGRRDDNRIINLRAVDQSLNQRNRRPRKDSRSGIVGVYLVPSTGHYQANIRVDNRTIYLGTHTDLDAAIAARRSAEERYGYLSHNHRKAEGAR